MMKWGLCGLCLMGVCLVVLGLCGLCCVCGECGLVGCLMVFDEFSLVGEDVNGVGVFDR